MIIIVVGGGVIITIIVFIAIIWVNFCGPNISYHYVKSNSILVLNVKRQNIKH